LGGGRPKDLISTIFTGFENVGGEKRGGRPQQVEGAEKEGFRNWEKKRIIRGRSMKPLPKMRNHCCGVGWGGGGFGVWGGGWRKGRLEAGSPERGVSPL